MRDLNLFRPDHPGFTGAASPPSQAAAGEAYTGDFNTKTVDATKFVGQIFADGVYTLPAELKESALGIARLLMEIEGANIKTVLPGLGLKDGDVSTEYVASYIMTLAMETYRPNNLQRVLKSTQIRRTARSGIQIYQLIRYQQAFGRSRHCRCPPDLRATTTTKASAPPIHRTISLL